MKKLNCALLLSLLMLLLVGCSKVDNQSETLKSSDDVTLKKADKFKPFHATFEVYIDLNSIILRCPNPPCPPFNDDFPPSPLWYEGDLVFLKYQIVYGEGNVTHLGNTGVEITQWWRPLELPPEVPYHGVGIGEFIFTAANGDQLLAVYDDAESFHATDTYVTLIYTGHFKDGGTGRFANAEGSFIWEGEFNPVTNFGTVTATGKIKYSK